MNHKGTVFIETERLILRRFTENDVEAMFRNRGGDPKVTEFLCWKTAANLKDAENVHQGITSEAFKAIIPFFFNEVCVNRIESQHDPNNPNSGYVMKKCGLKYEGTLRESAWNNKGIVDVCIAY